MATLETTIRQYRENLGLTQGDLAQQVGVRRETILNLERGKYNPSLKLAMDISNILNQPVEVLFQWVKKNDH